MTYGVLDRPPVHALLVDARVRTPRAAGGRVIGLAPGRRASGPDEPALRGVTEVLLHEL